MRSFQEMSAGDEEFVVDEVIDEHFPFRFDCHNCVKQGAEGRIFGGMYLGRNVMVKERFSKKYRHPTMDNRLNTNRVKSEVRGIAKARQLGVGTPSIYLVDVHRNLIVMEAIEGSTMRDWIGQQRAQNIHDFEEKVQSLGSLMGAQVAELHNGNVIHGDLTTSNVILRHNDPSQLVFIDFGLSSQMKVNVEEKAVDLYVLERAIRSTHVGSEALIESILKGYQEKYQKQGALVMAKLEEVRLRGRKRDMAG